MLNIANPIYDTIFKYLMEDERIARTILSALLKKEVLHVEMKRHEYTNGTRDKISMFRIDFAARIRGRHGLRPRHCASASTSARTMPTQRTCSAAMTGVSATASPW